MKMLFHPEDEGGKLPLAEISNVSVPINVVLINKNTLFSQKGHLYIIAKEGAFTLPQLFIYLLLRCIRY